MRATPNVEAASPDTRNRWLRLFMWVGLAIVAGWIVMVSAKVLFPSQGHIQSRSDAVVSLAPQVHRLYTATQLIEAGHTDTLLVSPFDGDVGGE